MMNLVKSRVRFDSEAHTYTLDGKSLQGITGMIDRRLFGGKYTNTDPAFLKKYADYGTLVHNELEEYFIVGIEPSTPEAKAFVEWFYNECGLVDVSAEYTVSDDVAFATNIDLVTEDGIWDYKTTKEIDTERVRWQLSIAAYLFELQNGYAPKNLYVAHLRGEACHVRAIEPIEREKVIELLEAEKGQLAVVSDTTDIQKLVDIEQALITLQIEAKRLETVKAEVLSKIEAEMERTGTKKIDTERLMITRVLPTTTQRLDTKKLEAENPELCARYKVPSEKKGFIRLTIKDNDPAV
jgi:hypothetical protein